MTCPCVFFASYRPSLVEGLLKPDLAGYQSGGVYTVQQIERFSKNSNRYAEVDEPYFLAFGVTPIRPRDPVVASNNREISLFQDPSKAEKLGQKKPKVKRPNENKKCIAHLKDKEHASKAKHTVKRYWGHDSNITSSQDHVPHKKRQAKFEVEKKLEFTSAGDDKKQSSPSLFKETSISKVVCEIKSLVQDVRFVEKVQSSDASVPSKTQHKPEDSPAASKDRETTLTSSPRIKRTKGEISRIVKEPQEEPKTILSMKFPPDTALPSVSELKAKFARFGPIETSDIRASWMKS
ncbi:hypothetical protein L6452_16847 [Arctium lappa]|uniref:Uncharacterized protein n=1 Tax=Arctium lappa TaxID=4217 RepID=A0ACB9C1W4_ARCLA|nr:hypothetical protein L6452_16847 [Arctium lappa]